MLAANAINGVHDNWVWVITSLFGVILGFGFQKLENTLADSWGASKKCFTGHLFVALVFAGFVVYDVTVYSIFVKITPYTSSPLGALRFVLDLVMAFGMYVLIRRGMGTSVWDSFHELVVGLSTWHLAGILWHFIAYAEKHELPPIFLTAPHVVYIGVYWLLDVLHRRALRLKPQMKDSLNRRYVVALALVVLVIAVSRTWQIVHRFPSVPTVSGN